MDGEALAIAGARGEVGSTTDLFVQLPAGRTPATVTVNGQPAEIGSRAPTGVTVRATFDGTMFRHYQPVVEVPEGFAGGKVTGTFTIPRRIIDQLAARRKAWPIPWTPEDFRTTWLMPGTSPVVRPDRGAGRALGRTADHRRSHGGAEEGVLGHPERGKDLRRLLRRSVDAGCGSSGIVRARAAEAGSRSAAGRVLRECGDGVHGKDRKVLEVLGF